MVFNPCPHKITQIVIQAGRIIRQLKGLPEERNITIIYEETALLLGIPVTQMNSQMADHLPSSAEMKDSQGGFIIPRKDCPKCGKKDTFILESICPGCKDSEGGKFHSGWKCDEIFGGCGFIDDKSTKFLTQRLMDEYPEIELPNGLKEALGIRTITNNGSK